MKRDMDLIRTILLQIEEKGGNPFGSVALAIPDHSPAAVSHHILLLHDAGLIHATDDSTTAEFRMEANRLTWEGHEFLDAARNDTVWNKAKDIVKEKGGTIPFEVLKGLLIKLAASLVGLG